MLIFRSLRAHDVVIGGVLRAFIGEDYLSVGNYDISVLCLDIILLLLLVADVLVRYSHHLKDEEPYWGFLEWLGAGRKKHGKKIAVTVPVSAAPPVIQPVVREDKAPEPLVRPIPIRMPKL